MNQIFDGKHFRILDGATATMLQQCGLCTGAYPEILSITHPDEIEKLHRAYVQAGSDLICANTFGANARKLANTGYTVQEVISASVTAAKRAVRGTDARVMLDVGPISGLTDPTGTFQKDEIYELYREVVTAGEQAGADLIKFATMSDLYELKTAILAAKEYTKLPILASMTFQPDGRTFTGCTVESFGVFAEAIGVEGVGINCSLGPDAIYPIAKRLCASTDLPVFIKPNAGLPNPETGAYPMDAEAFCAAMEPYKELGICAVGGCCGTTPEHISLLKQSFSGVPVHVRPAVTDSIVCTPTRTVNLSSVKAAGERINPNGKKHFQQELKNGDTGYILQQAVKQAAAGADILDINVCMPEVNEKMMMVKAINAVQSVCDLPIQLDSTDAEVLEAGLRVCKGKPIVNSVNAEDTVLETILPLCRKYGAAVIGMTLDASGVPHKAEERLALAEKIVNTAEKAGIPRKDVCIDCLAPAACAQQDAIEETLKAVRMVKERLGVKTVLGISNISFGLPHREFMDAAFLTLALANGLDLPILNPNEEPVMAALASYRVLANEDRGAQDYLRRYAQPDSSSTEALHETTLRDAVLRGLEEMAVQKAREALKIHEPQKIVDAMLIPALEQASEAFENGEVFLPQLMRSASAAQAALHVLQEETAEKKLVPRGRVLVAAVRGDQHDLGKNMVKTMLEGSGFEVLDLGCDVPAEAVVKAAIQNDVRLICLSALLSTALGSMEETIRAVRRSGHPCSIMVGGAVLTREYAQEIGADFFAENVKQSVDIARTVFG